MVVVGVTLDLVFFSCRVLLLLAHLILTVIYLEVPGTSLSRFCSILYCATTTLLSIFTRYLKMHEERVSDSATRQLNTEVAHVKTWNGRVLPIELYGELQIRQNQQVEDLTAVTCRDDQIALGGDDAAIVAPKVLGARRI